MRAFYQDTSNTEVLQQVSKYADTVRFSGNIISYNETFVFNNCIILKLS